MSTHIVTWIALIAAIIACYGLKFVGYLIPEKYLNSPKLMSVASHVTIALLAGLVVVQTFELDGSLVLDARVAGLATAILLLLLRAPFLVIVIAAAFVAAALRWVGWMI